MPEEAEVRSGDQQMPFSEGTDTIPGVPGLLVSYYYYYCVRERRRRAIT
jgi:hypothetical protein